MSEEKTAKFLAYKESSGTPVKIVIEPDTDIKERVGFLKKHGCTDLTLLDEDEKVIGPA